MFILVDKVSGTWFEVSDDLVVVEAPDEDVDNLDNMSDSEIGEWAGTVKNVSSLPQLLNLHYFFSGEDR